MSSNPVANGRQFIYDRLAANSTFLSGLSSRWFNRRPAQGVTPPFAFINSPSMRIQSPLGTGRNDGNGLIDIHIVIGRDDKLSALEPLVTEATTTLQSTFGSTSKGLVNGCTVTDIFERPYDIGSDEYMQQIIRVRVTTN